MNWQTFLNSEFFWTTVVGVWLTNSIATIAARKLPKTGAISKFVRALHGLLDKIDPPEVPPAAAILLAIGLVLPAQGCSFFRSPTFWDTVNTTCEIALAATPEVQAKAQASKLTPGALADILCGVADVIEPFVRQELASKEGRKMATDPAAEAVEIAKGKGLL